MHVSNETYRQSTRLDTAGFIASFICAIHCAVMPLVLASLPLTGLAFVAGPVLDIIMMGISLGIASISLFRGYLSYHRKITALIIVLIGFGLIAYGDLLAVNFKPWYAVAGALLVAISHIVNHFLTRAALVNEQPAKA